MHVDFVPLCTGGTTLGTTGAKTEEVKAAPAPEPAAAAEPMQTSSDDCKSGLCVCVRAVFFCKQIASILLQSEHYT